MQVLPSPLHLRLPPERKLMNDYELTPTGWIPKDQIVELNDGEDVHQALLKSGWQELLTIGDPDHGHMYIKTWSRAVPPRLSEYLIEVGSIIVAGPFLQVPDFPTLMEIIARWAPAVQAAEVAGVISELRSPGLDSWGLMELIGARAAWGANTLLPQLQKEHDKEIERRMQRRAARRS